MKVLLVVRRGFGDDTPFELAAKMAGRGVEVAFLLAHGGLRRAVDPEFRRRLGFAEIYALAEGGQGCGPSEVEEATRVDYAGWVELLEAYDKVFSWS